MLPHYTNEHKCKVAKTVYTIALICYVLLCVTTYFDNILFFIQAVSSAVIALLSLSYIILFKKYKLPVYITIVLSFFVHFIGFFTDSFVGNQADLFWIIVITCMAFYMIGKQWALLYIIVNIGNMSIFKILSVNEQIVPLVAEIPPHLISKINYLVNILFCSILLIYLANEIIKDIKRAERSIELVNEELRMRHSEKTIMLKEIHHRVKNNLQVIISLLRLQLHKLEGEESKAPFKDSINRISTMALIHEKMYQGDEVRNVQLIDYLTDLANSLNMVYPLKNNIDFNIESTLHELYLDDIIPLSLIINELITNSIKHGFKQIDNGIIDIDIRHIDKRMYLEYKDNGTWLPSIKGNGFGLELIETLTGHFDGSFELNTEVQTQFKFEFVLS